MLQSALSINRLITDEVDAGMDPSRIVLGGFSQGATMSLLTGLTGERKLGGLLVLSGWLPLRHKFKAVRVHSFAFVECINIFVRWLGPRSQRRPSSGVMEPLIPWSNSSLA